MSVLIIIGVCLKIFTIVGIKEYVQKNSKVAYVNTSDNTNTSKVIFSESQGYGMLITVLAAKHGWANKQDFNALYNYYLNHRDTVRKKQTNLMSWKQVIKNNKLKNKKNSATDGDIFIAEALIQAHKLWPQNNLYFKQAKALCKDILTYEFNPKNNILTVGNWATSNSKYYNLLRCSDTMPDYFDDFYNLTHDYRWKKVKRNMLNYLNILSKQHKTGLIPDFAWINRKNASPVKDNDLTSKYDDSYYYNSCRLPMILADSSNPTAKKY